MTFNAAQVADSREAPRPGLFTSDVAERAYRITQDGTYRRALAAHVRRSLIGMAVGAVGAAVSYYQLSQPTDSLQVYQFWLLCLLLGGGLFGVAVLVLIGAAIRHLAMWRLAVGLKDQEAYEAAQDAWQMESRIEVLELLCERATAASWPVEPELLRMSLAFIRESRHPSDDGALRSMWDQVAIGWRAHGITEDVLRNLRSAGSGQAVAKKAAA